MQAMRWFGFAFLVLLLTTPAVMADEKPDSSTERLIEKALDALKLRIEARIKEGELLSKSGRIEEALEAYRSVAEIYDRGMAALTALFAGKPATVTQREREPRALQPRAAAVTSADAALDRALAWLAAHQSPTGAWEAAGFTNWCNRKPIVNRKFAPDGAGKPAYDVGVTGLALLAFLGNGYTHQGTNPYAKAIGDGFKYLKTVQDAEGCFGPRGSQHFIYNHVLAALATVEAYALTRSPICRRSAQKALDFLALARNPYTGWRYGVRPGDSDSSVTSWAVMSLRSAQLVNAEDLKEGRPATFTIDESGFDGALAWIEKVTDTATGRVGYVQRGSLPARPQDMLGRFPPEKSEAMTAAGILTRLHCGQPVEHALVKKGADLCAKRLPVWNPADGSIDMYYWTHATHALHRIGGKGWRAWSGALDRAVVATQRRDGDACSFLGSWDPIGPWGADGGRVYATALMALTLAPKAAEERAGKVFGKAAKPPK